jgi:hypothetical protein
LAIANSTSTVDNPLADHRSHALGIDLDIAFCYALDFGVDQLQENRVGWDNDNDECIAPDGTPHPELQLDRELAEQIMDAQGDAAMHASDPDDPATVNHFHIRFQELL